MKKTFAIIGLNPLGLHLVEELSQLDAEVIAIDQEEELVAKAGEFITNAFICDLSSEAALSEVGIEHAEHAIITLDHDLPTSILLTVILSEMKIPKITVSVSDDFYHPIFKKLGATEIVSPFRIAGSRLANKIISDSFIDYFNIGEDFCLVELSIDINITPKEIAEINEEHDFDINLLVIKRKEKFYLPKDIEMIKPGDLIVVFGIKKKVAQFDHYLHQ